MSTQARKGTLEARLSRVEEAVINDIPHRLDALRDRISSLDAWVKGIVIALFGAMGSLLWAATRIGK